MSIDDILYSPVCRKNHYHGQDYSTVPIFIHDIQYKGVDSYVDNITYLLPGLHYGIIDLSIDRSVLLRMIKDVLVTCLNTPNPIAPAGFQQGLLTVKCGNHMSILNSSKLLSVGINPIIRLISTQYMLIRDQKFITPTFNIEQIIGNWINPDFIALTIL